MMSWTTALALLFFFALTAEALKPVPQISLKKFTTSEERIKSHGYPAESHFVETSDGYVLNVFRIPYSNKLDNQRKYRPVVLLQHGLMSDSDCYLSSGPDNSLAYNLADAGYDVWLGNARGNIYSKKNTRVSLNSPRFWQFSWHEIGILDVASMIDYILAETGQEALHYAGHSQGTTAFFVLMSERPEYNDKVKSAHMLAPCAFFEHGNSPVFRLMAPLLGTPGGMWSSALGDMELLPKNDLINRLIDSTCSQSASQTFDPYCRNMYLWFTGDGYENMNMSSLQVLLETHPAGGSTNQGIHYLQLSVSHKFRQFDYGEKRNKQVYKQATPPDYDLSKITAPTYLYSSANDALCGPKDVDILVAHMPQLAEDYRIENPTWNHLDFIAAEEIKKTVNDPVIERANKHEK